jgi:HK97 family phage major capsid protein
MGINKRAVTGGELLIPEVVLGLIREQVEQNSKLIKYVNRQTVGGTGRQIVMGTIPEGVWTEMCGKVNEMNLVFNDAEVDGYKVGAYVALCNALIEDNDVNLVEQVIFALGRAIGLALDKAILYGTGTKMPTGIVTRLAQAAAPENYPTTMRAWADLHTTNILKITAANSKGVTLFQELIKNFGAAKKKYGAGGKFFAMNEKTHMNLIAEALNFNAAGAIVAGIDGTMPAIGGDIVELDFIPDDNIIAGYGDLYLLAERADVKIASSEHAMFIEDKTVFKGTARYDGLPVIAEGFVVIGVNNVTPATTATFASDTANA